MVPSYSAPPASRPERAVSSDASRVAGSKTRARRTSRNPARPDDLSERAVAWVERECAEQGVPVKLSDPLALAEIAEILGSPRDARSGDR